MLDSIIILLDYLLISIFREYFLIIKKMSVIVTILLKIKSLFNKNL